MNAALVVAAGTGKRMGTEVPKQFLKLHGETILFHTLQALHQSGLFQHLVVVVHPDWIDSDEVRSLSEKFHGQSLLVVAGGQERADSVFEGLKVMHELLTDDSDIVMVHDAVRPFISSALIADLVTVCLQYDSAIPVIAMKDSLRRLDPLDQEQTFAVDRNLLRAVQTPQAFKFKLLYQAYLLAGIDKSQYTDEASLFESMIKPVKTTKGSDANFKITTPFDWRIAETLMTRREL